MAPDDGLPVPGAADSAAHADGSLQRPAADDTAAGRVTTGAGRVRPCSVHRVPGALTLPHTRHPYTLLPRAQSSHSRKKILRRSGAQKGGASKALSPPQVCCSGPCATCVCARCRHARVRARELARADREPAERLCLLPHGDVSRGRHSGFPAESVQRLAGAHGKTRAEAGEQAGPRGRAGRDDQTADSGSSSLDAGFRQPVEDSSSRKPHNYRRSSVPGALVRRGSMALVRRGSMR
jgi:hypothetical protein